MVWSGKQGSRRGIGQRVEQTFFLRRSARHQQCQWWDGEEGQRDPLRQTSMDSMDGRGAGKGQTGSSAAQHDAGQSRPKKGHKGCSYNKLSAKGR